MPVVRVRESHHPAILRTVRRATGPDLPPVGGLARPLGDEAAWECELREAHRLFVEVGATGHAERISRQLSVVSPKPEER